MLNVIGPQLSAPAGWDPSRPYESQDLLRLRLSTHKRVREWGFLRKNRESDRLLLADLLKRSHYLIHPASHEWFGVALADANAYGVPVLARDVFGPASVVRPGVTGHLFQSRDFVSAACELVQCRLGDRKRYRAEALAALAESRTRLNWRTSCQRLLEAVDNRLGIR